MRVVLASPLYPPDAAAPAPYIKELAARLPDASVIVVAYGKLPEQVPGVRIVPVNKQQPLALRLVSFFFTLLRETKQADVLFFENGASVELPMALVSFFRRARVVMHLGDAAAHAHAQQSGVYGAIEKFARSRAAHVIEKTPQTRPEILPLAPYPTQAFAAYEQSWQEHLAELSAAFNHD